MSVICPNCGAENRERARYCSRCAGAIPWAASPTDGGSADPRPGGEPGAQKKKRRASQRPDEAAANPAFTRPAGAPRWILVAAAIAVVGLVAVFWAVLPKGNKPQDAAKTSVPLTAPTVVPVPSATSTTTVPDPAASGESAAAATPAALAEQTEAANQKLQQSLEQLQAEDALKSAERKEQRQKALEERERRQQQQAEAARRRAEEAAAAQAANARPGSAVPAASQTPAAAVAPAVPAVPAPAGPSVEQACAGAGNIFSRDFCRIRECGKAENANDPICVQYKEMNRQRRTGNF